MEGRKVHSVRYFVSNETQQIEIGIEILLGCGERREGEGGAIL